MNEEDISRIIRHYIRIHNGHDVGDDVHQEVWVRLLETAPDLLAANEKTGARLWSTIHGLVRNCIRDVRRDFYSVANGRSTLEDRWHDNDQGINFLIDDLLELLRPVSYLDVARKRYFLYLLIEGEKPESICEEFAGVLGLSEVCELRELVKNGLRTCPEKYLNTNFSLDIYNSHSETPIVPKIYEDFQKYTKTFRRGHNLYCHAQFFHIKPKVIDEVIDYFNQGLSNTETFHRFAYHTKYRDRLNSKPRVSHWNVRAIRRLCDHISEEQAIAYERANPLPESPRIAPNGTDLNTLEDIEAHLNHERSISQIIYGNHTYLLIKLPCAQCLKKNVMQVFPDEHTGELVYCCMSCRGRGKDHLHNLYKKYHGRSLDSLFAMLGIETIEDYCV